jgi:hypothetical protein
VTAPVASREVTATPAADAPKPFALANQRVGPLDSGERRAEIQPWNVTIFAGAERGSEDFTAPATLGHLGAEATRSFWENGLALVQFDWRMSRQTYVLGQPSSVAGDRSTVDEHRYDALVGVGYDFGHLFDGARLQITPMVGLKYIRLQNRAYPADLFGVDLMGRIRYALSSAVAVHGSLGWMYNVIHPASFSALGSPLGQFGYRAGLEFPLKSGYALSLDYQGDILAFDYSYRVAHGATAGFGKSF